MAVRKDEAVGALSTRPIRKEQGVKTLLCR